MPVTFHRLAALEFVDARRWYLRRSATIERRFVAADEAVIQQLDTNPALGSPWQSAIRWVRVRATVTLSISMWSVPVMRRRTGYWIRRITHP